MTIEELKHLKESEDKVEFKEAKHNFPFNGGSHREQKERRKCYLGYIVALANEGGGYLILGMADKEPYQVVGSDFANGEIGALEDAVYENLKIRVHIEELFDKNGLRVVITTVPSRPFGKTLKFEGVPLMRTGDSLRNMSDEEVFKILSEQEPDFSAKICPDLSLSDLDDDAIKIFKEKYALKQNNESFKNLNTEQTLCDVGLLTDKGITYAALILLAKEDALKKYLPNTQVNIEYRQALAQTHFDKREVFVKPLFIAIDEIWDYLNLRNTDNKIAEGPYKFDLPYFNEEVIRESVLNAIAHRDYTISSEIVIKQYPDRITILNPGGFPKGVTKDNLITVSSTPRSRLLTEILEKTGLVERSGQGVDKIYRITLSEGKDWPDYSKTDFYQVELTIKGKVQDKAFAIFIGNIQKSRGEYEKLGAFEVIGLYNIKEGRSSLVNGDIIDSLENGSLIKRVGGSASNNYNLIEDHYELKSQKTEILGFRSIDIKRIADVFKSKDSVKMSDFVKAFEGDLTRDQVRYLIEKLTDLILFKKGSGKGTVYTLSNKASDIETLMRMLIPHKKE